MGFQKLMELTIVHFILTFIFYYIAKSVNEAHLVLFLNLVLFLFHLCLSIMEANIIINYGIRRANLLVRGKLVLGTTRGFIQIGEITSTFGSFPIRRYKIHFATDEGTEQIAFTAPIIFGKVHYNPNVLYDSRSGLAIVPAYDMPKFDIAEDGTIHLVWYSALLPVLSSFFIATTNYVVAWHVVGMFSRWVSFTP